MANHLVTFRNGQKVLTLGQGTWNMGKNPNKKTTEIMALRTGINLGMSVIDTAEMYENEEMVGEAIQGLRDKIFLVSKVLPQNAGYNGTLQACERSLTKLKTDYLDLYLLHWSGSHPFGETVSAMLKLQQDGKIRQWGVSNMDVPQMEQFFTIPEGNTCAANQVAYNLQTRGIEYDLIPWCTKRRVPVMAYSPLGEGDLVKHKLLVEIAKRHEATATQIALAWTMRNPNIITIPKASSAAHIEDNFTSLSIELTEEDIIQLDKIFPPPTRKIPFVGW